MNKMTLTEWAKRNKQWFALFDKHEMDVAELVRRDPEIKGAWVGPLIKVPIGISEEDDDGQQCACFDEGEDGVTLFLAMHLPHIADLLLWANGALAKLNGVHFDSTTEAGNFNVELRGRIDRIICGINGRPDKAGPGVMTT